MSEPPAYPSRTICFEKKKYCEMMSAEDSGWGRQERHWCVTSDALHPYAKLPGLSKVRLSIRPYNEAG